jgi:REP element-mobilizing transposase RayT
MASPRAFLLTWTTRGSWIHGDERGSWQAIRGQPRADFIARSQQPPVQRGLVLPPPARATAEVAMRRVCDHRSWLLHAMQVRSNHVHVVVSAPDTPPEAIMRQLKSWATRAVRESGLVGAEDPVWTRHGSTRYLWKEDAVRRAVLYVRDWQDGERFEQT